MGTNERFWALCAASAVAISAAASGCNDNDHTEICVGPDCPTYDGVGGERNFFRSGDPEPTAGSAGAAGTDEEPPDAGADATVDPPDSTPDGGDTPEPPACELAFTAPVATGDLTLDGASDTDGEACGSQFGLTVSLSSNASSVTLFINDNPLGSQSVVDGAVSFEAVLGNRGGNANVLRAEATMADSSTCSLTFPSSVFVDCPGPSCSVDSPLSNDAGYLNDEQDVDAALGFQVDIGVGTEAEHAGESVRLEIDDSFGDVPDAVVLEDAGEGIATFGNVTLAEGSHTVRAECSDAFGVTTLSAPVTWNVDVTPCELSLTSLGGVADPITPSSDVDGSTPGIQVLAAGTITGGDCETLWIGACGGTLVPLPLSLPEDGSFSLPITLTGSTGSLDVCGTVEDEAGNMSAQDQITVNLRLEAPQVAIGNPSGGTRFNAAGTAGATPDGNALTTSCEVDVLVHCSEVGTNVELAADGSVIATAPCTAPGGGGLAGQASFSLASLSSKNDGSATLLTATHTIAGFDPAVSAAVSVFADCEAPACNLVGPNPGLDFLNAALDSVPGGSFQITFDVESDANNVGQNVQLSIDGSNGPPAAALVAQGGGSAVSFADVDLSEGSHTAQASCVDAAGNVQLSTSEQWTVDSVACSSSLQVSGSNPIIPSDDVGADPGLQVSVSGTTTGGDCTSVRVGVCGALGGSSALGSPSFSLEATLPSVTASADVCVEVTDAAGNVGSVQTTVAVRVDPPVVAITAPGDGSAFNLASVNQCDTTVVASCTDVGDPVTLYVDSAPADVQTCQNDNTVSFGFTLATKNDGSLTNLAVEQISDGLTSLLDSIDVQADCVAPVLAFSDPTCGSVLGLVTDDVDAAAGLQTDVTVQNDGNPSVLLTVTRGGSVISTDTLVGDSISTTFPAVDLGGVGQVDLSACATDPQGNQGCVSTCLLDISTEPVISITSPLDSDTLLLADDCSGGTAGLQVTVTGTTDAADDSEVEVQIGAAAPSTVLVSAGAFSACVDAPHGLSEIVTATVSDDVTALVGTTSIDIVVNALSAISAPTASVVGRRQGTMQFTWDPVNDPLGSALDSYQLRCSRTDITDEASWSTATPFTINTVPAPAGAPQSDVLSGFKTGANRFCVLRGVDDLGLVTPLPALPSATVANPFLTNAYTVTTTTAFRIGLAAIGDVNGDGEDDFIVGSENNGAQVFFGGSLDTTADITFDGITTGRFGAGVAGLGDVNGDTRPDFAISASTLANGATASAGSVFILFGRDSSNPWPGTVTLAANPGCGADVCVHGTQASALLGSAVATANFDGAGPMDLVIGAQNQNTRIGRVYVVLGGAQLTSGSIFTLPGDNPDGFQIDPTAIDSFLGSSLAPVGTGGDAFGDLVIGAIGRTTGSVPGAAYFIPGRAHSGSGGGLTAITAGVTEQFATGNPAQFATAMGGLGDYDGDGNADVCVAHDFQTASGGGNCRLYLGRSPGQGGGFTSSSVLQFANDVGDNDWSFYVAQGFNGGLGLIGDLDGDGLGEALFGSLTTGVFNTGTAELFYGAVGAAARPRSNADHRSLTADQGNIGASFVGDIDGDGFNDLAVFDTDAGTTSRVTLLY